MSAYQNAIAALQRPERLAGSMTLPGDTSRKMPRWRKSRITKTACVSLGHGLGHGFAHGFSDGFSTGFSHGFSHGFPGGLRRCLRIFHSRARHDNDTIGGSLLACPHVRPIHRFFSNRAWRQKMVRLLAAQIVR
jgi:hypothetical protein